MHDTYIITDVGSTTTKAILVGVKEGQYRLLGRAEAPTTVEKPHEDVTVGVLDALSRLSDVVGEDLVKPVVEKPGGRYRYLSTSSAGGGLQVLVLGLTTKVTADSASRAALGGGAIILNVIASDDGRQSFAKIDAIKNSRPDMVLISGGLDGGNTDFVLEACDLLNAASPVPRFGKDFKIPVIYAGNKDASPLVKDTLLDRYDVTVVPNLRPAFDREELQPARDAIGELFMSHVMKQAPGYATLSSWVDGDIMPTPSAVGRIMQEEAGRKRCNILGVDIGGATTDVFSVIQGAFFRSVSANMGMSYSSGNVLVEAGIDNVARWLPLEIPQDEVSDRILTKLINPTSLPADEVNLYIEQALATEALRLSLDDHRRIATNLPDKAGSFETKLFTRNDPVALSSFNMGEIHLIVGSGGVLSHAPRRSQAAFMMLNAFLPEGITLLAVDSIFTMPHLGVLAQINPDAALSVLEKDCLIPLGPVIAPTGTGDPGSPGVSVEVQCEGDVRTVDVGAGEVGLVPLKEGLTAKVKVRCHGAFRLEGSSRVEFEAQGRVGIIIDARGRPLTLPDDATERTRAVARWAQHLGTTGRGGR